MVVIGAIQIQSVSRDVHDTEFVLVVDVVIRTNLQTPVASDIITWAISIDRRSSGITMWVAFGIVGTRLALIVIVQCTRITAIAVCGMFVFAGNSN